MLRVYQGMHFQQHTFPRKRMAKPSCFTSCKTFAYRFLQMYCTYLWGFLFIQILTISAVTVQILLPFWQLIRFTHLTENWCNWAAEETLAHICWKPLHDNPMSSYVNFKHGNTAIVFVLLLEYFLTECLLASMLLHGVLLFLFCSMWNMWRCMSFLTSVFINIENSKTCLKWK